MLIKKLRLILILTFFCSNLAASSPKSLTETFQELLAAIQIPKNATNINRIISTCDNPIGLLSFFTEKYRDIVKDEPINRKALNDQISFYRARLRELRREPQHSRKPSPSLGLEDDSSGLVSSPKPGPLSGLASSPKPGPLSGLASSPKPGSLSGYDKFSGLGLLPDLEDLLGPDDFKELFGEETY